MSDQDLMTVANTLVEYCRTQQEAKGLEELYAPSAISVEPAPGPDGKSAVSEGIEAIKAKHEWWDANFEVHGGSVDGPFPHGEDRFAVIFSHEATHKASGQRSEMKEVAVYTVGNGKIVREEFFYPPE